MNRKLVISCALLVSISLAIIAFGVWCLGTTAGVLWLIHSVAYYADL